MSVAGALAGIRIIEIAAIGPCPFAGMMLADHGAEVIRIDRPGGTRGGVQIDRAADVLARSRRSIVVDMKSPEGVALVRDLCRTADGLIEGFRPKVMERLGLGPDVLMGDNPRLVYGRMTGWGQDGPYAAVAGHDLNYIALAGALHYFGRAGEKPTPPINMIGDFGGGGMLLAFGMLAGLLSARTTGKGQVVDCAMAEGAALLMSMVWGLNAQGAWRSERGCNELDTGAPFYEVYETRDGRFVALGAIEPQFYQEFRRRAGLLDDPAFDHPYDRAEWPALKGRLTSLFRSRTRDEWCACLDGSDTCFAPVLTMAEAVDHPHSKARGSFATVAGIVQPAPAPRFGLTPARTPTPPAQPGSDTAAILAELGRGPQAMSPTGARLT